MTLTLGSVQCSHEESDEVDVGSALNSLVLREGVLISQPLACHMWRSACSILGPDAFCEEKDSEVIP